MSLTSIPSLLYLRANFGVFRNTAYFSRAAHSSLGRASFSSDAMYQGPYYKRRGSNRQPSEEGLNLFSGFRGGGPLNGFGEESLYGGLGRGGGWGTGHSYASWSLSPDRQFRSGSPGREPEPPAVPQWFKLSDSCLLCLQRGDITEWFVDKKTDAIVNAANERMLGGGGVDGAIHSAAGPALYEACKAIPEVERGVRCPTGQAKITPGFRLPVHAIIHTVGPIYHGKRRSEPDLIASYKNSIALAAENNIQYLAFPAISCGVYGYPYDDAAIAALQTCQESADKLKEIHFVLFDRPAWRAWLDAAEKLQLPSATVDEDARKESKQQAEREWRERPEQEQAGEAKRDREAKEQLRSKRGEGSGRHGRPQMFRKDPEERARSEVRGPGTFVHEENIDRKLVGRRDYSRLQESTRDAYEDQEVRGLKDYVHRENYFTNDGASALSGGTEKDSTANKVTDWDLGEPTGWTRSEPTEKVVVVDEQLGSERATPTNEAQSALQAEKEVQGDGLQPEQPTELGFEKTVPSSSGSFHTPKVDFEDDMNGEESGRSVSKRLRSNREQKNKEGKTRPLIESDGWHEKLKEGSHEMSEEAQEERKAAM